MAPLCRQPVDRFSMISEKEARTKVLEKIRPMPPQQLPIADALHHFVSRAYR